MQRPCGKAEHDAWWDMRGNQVDVNTDSIGRLIQETSAEVGGGQIL